MCSDRFSSPNDTKTVYNAKRKVRTISDPSPKEDFFKNVSLSFVNDDSPKCYVLFTDLQIKDLLYHIRNFETVIGIDRTFNVGKLYLTTMVYKNRRVLRKQSKDHPLVLGPCFLHRDSKLKDYGLFLSHVKTAMMDHVDADSMLEIEKQMVFGSDEEKALVKAIRCIFPNASRRLCSLHLKKNITRKMIEYGIDIKRRNQIASLFYNDNNKNPSSFEQSRQKIKQMTVDNDKLSKYLLKQFEVYHMSGLYTDWTNNNSESINNSIKSELDRRAHETGELIRRLSNIVEEHYLNVKLALCGLGDFMLFEVYRR